MTQKLLLAEGLDLLRRTEATEYEVDRSQIRIISSNKYRRELSRLVQAYSSVYQDYLRGVEIINYVRRCAMESNDPNSYNLINLCEGKMTAYMDRCELVRKKEDNILLPLDQVDSFAAKASFEITEPIFVLSGALHPIKRKESFHREEQLGDGSYLFTVRNLDTYSVAAPIVKINVEIIPQKGAPQRMEKIIPSQCGWRRVIGVVGGANIKINATTDGLVRDSHVDIALHRLEPTDTTTTTNNNNNNNNNVSGAGMDALGVTADKLVAQLPKLSDDELALLANTNVPNAALPSKNTNMNILFQNNNQNNNQQGETGGGGGGGHTMEQLQSLNVPHVNARSSAPPFTVLNRIEINPAGLNCEGRLSRLRATLNAWPSENVMAAPLSKEQQYTLQAVYALPFPNEISD